MRRALVVLAVGAALLAGPPQVRTVVPQGAGAQRLDLDLTLLARAARDFHDLRLVDAQGRELPYVLVPPAATSP